MTYSPATRKALGLLILVFALGIAFGAVGTLVFNAHVYGALVRPLPPQPTTPLRAVARLNQDVNLSADQQKQIGAIIASMQSGYDVVRQQMIPQFDVIREEGRNRIRQTLTADQRPKFEEYLRKLDEERRKRAAAAAAAAATAAANASGR